jgi:general secretion pathway protein B
MSLILDALKKLEQEKAARRIRQVELRPAITGRRDTASAAPWRLPLLSTVAVILAVVVTIVVMGRIPHQSQPVTPEPAQVREESPRPMAPTTAVLPLPVQSPVIIATPPAPAQVPSPTVVTPSTPPRTKRTEPVLTGPAPADLKVTGIAWQDERAARRAVVNGALAGEGAVIAGAKVIEIRQEQVRFTRDGQTFAVPITSSNR